MQCVILAGGLGTATDHRAADLPKAMIEVAGEPFIRHQLRLLHAGSVDDVVICVGYRGEAIEAEVVRYCPENMTVRCIRDGRRVVGTAGAVRLAVESGLADEQFMVLYGDSYVRVDFADVWAAFDIERHLALMTVWRNDDIFDHSNAGVSDGRVAVYRKGVERSNHPSLTYIDYGLGVLTADAVLDLVPTGVPYDLAGVYGTIAAQGRLQAYEVHERFHEIGSESGLAELDRLLTSEFQR